MDNEFIIKTAIDLSGLKKGTKEGKRELEQTFDGADNGGKLAKFKKNIGEVAKKGIKSMLLLGMGVKSVMALFQKLKKSAMEGVNNLARYSDDFNNSLSKTKSLFTQLKNSIGTAFAPLIEMILPVINRITQYVIEMTNKLANFFAMLNGQSQYAKAIAVNEDYAKSLGKVKNGLAGFDKLNTIGSKEQTDPKDMFEMVDVQTDLTDTTQVWLDLIAKGEAMFEKIKDYIAQELVPTFGELKGISIDLVQGNWSEAQDKFHNFVTSLQESVDKIDFRGISEKVAGLFNNIIENVDFRQLANDVASLWSKFRTTINTLTTSFIEEINWRKLGNDLWDALVGLITGIDYAGLLSTLFEFLGATLGGATALVVGFGEKLIEAFKVGWDVFANWFRETAFKNGQFSISGLFEGILDVFGNVTLWLYDNITAPFIKGFCKAFGIDGDKAETMVKNGRAIIEGFIAGLKEWTKKLTAPLDNILNKVTTTFNTIKTKVKTILTQLGAELKKPINTILSGIEFLCNKVIDGINNMIRALNSVSFDVPSWLPVIGGKKFGFNISQISNVSIPRLATGAVVPPNAPFMAMLGDNKKETEVVSPLSTMKQALAEVMANQNQTIVLTLDGKTVFESVAKYNNQYKNRTGVSRFV